MDKVIAITLNYNQNQYTIDCINSLLQSEYTNFEIYLIDNGSTTQNFIELQESLSNDSRLKIIRLENNIGYVGGVNHGLKLAVENHADYFLVMNNDTLIDKLAVKELVNAALRYNNKAIVSGKVYNYDNKETLQYIGNAESIKGSLDFSALVKSRNEKDIGQYDFEKEMGMLDDIFWLIPRMVFDKVGYYSKYFFLYGEQTDYAIRAKKVGIKLIYTHSAKLWHKGKITTSDGNEESPRIIYWKTFASLKVAILHLDKIEFKKFYYSLIFKRTIKRLIKIFKGKSSISTLKSQSLAIIHFNYWKKIRYEDNGYNPY